MLVFAELGLLAAFVVSVGLASLLTLVALAVLEMRTALVALTVVRVLVT